MDLIAVAIYAIYTNFYFWFLVALAMELSRRRLAAIAELN